MKSWSLAALCVVAAGAAACAGAEDMSSTVPPGTPAPVIADGGAPTSVAPAPAGMSGLGSTPTPVGNPIGQPATPTPGTPGVATPTTPTAGTPGVSMPTTPGVGPVRPTPGAPTQPTPTTGMPLPPATGGTMPTRLPAVKGMCPTLATGAITVNNVRLQAWIGNKAGDQGGPLIIYWHGTGGSAATAMAELDRTLVSETLASGGAIVSMESGQQGSALEWGVFTTGDFEIVDQVVACAVEQLKIDVRRIYTSGASAGGLAAGALAYARSGYIAGSFPNSGGVAPWPGLNVFQDTTQIPAVFTMHGALGKDTVVIEFTDSSLTLCRNTAAKGGFAVDCDHGGGHVAAPANLKAAAWTFMKAHPYGTKPSPYANGLPADFPAYCKIINK